METYYYGLIKENDYGKMICVAVIKSPLPIEKDDYIPVSELQIEFLLGKVWTGKEWIDDLNPVI